LESATIRHRQDAAALGASGLLMRRRRRTIRDVCVGQPQAAIPARPGIITRSAHHTGTRLPAPEWAFAVLLTTIGCFA
jgi:hypothetical protein